MQKYVEAFLDDYNLITVKIYRSFFNGNSDVFYLVDYNVPFALQPVSREEFSDCVVYKLETTFRFLIGQEYQIMIYNGKRCPLQYRFIVKTERFNKEFYYDGNDLGCTADGNTTAFKLWAPTATEVNVRIEDSYYPMKREAKGVFSVNIKKDLTKCEYQYLLKVNGGYSLINDPYGKASTLNSGKSVVVSADIDKNYLTIPMTLSSNYTDNIIYETSVRDFTAKGTFSEFYFNASYLKELGITHVQLMPVNDFASVDEYNSGLFYNWGYDPVQYQVIEGIYSSWNRDPEQGINDLRHLVNAMHENKIAVNLDVVFNHHYDAAESCFEKSVPYYYFRYNGEKYCSGTGCGNEFDTQQLMCRKYFLDTLIYYVKRFDVDGFRFDLMSFIDIETMKLFDSELRKIKPGIMLYGEGWKMAAGISDNLLTQYDKCDQVKNIAFFNDHFRDVIKGSTFRKEEKGYCSGNESLATEAVYAILSERFGSPNQSINYAECHDDMTLFDKLKASCPEKNEEQLKDIQQLITAVTVLSQGVPFIHGGQELYISHNGLNNTYNGPASVNNLENKKGDLSLYNYLSKVIDIRKKYHINRDNMSDIQIYNEGSIIIYKINNCPAFRNALITVINPTDDVYRYQLEKPCSVLLEKFTMVADQREEFISVPPRSLSILLEDEL